MAYGRYKKVPASRAGKSIWATDGIKAWNPKIEITILKKDKELTNYEAVVEAFDLCQELVANLDGDE